MLSCYECCFDCVLLGYCNCCFGGDLQGCDYVQVAGAVISKVGWQNAFAIGTLRAIGCQPTSMAPFPSLLPAVLLLCILLCVSVLLHLQRFHFSLYSFCSSCSAYCSVSLQHGAFSTASLIATNAGHELVLFSENLDEPNPNLGNTG